MIYMKSKSQSCGVYYFNNNNLKMGPVERRWQLAFDSYLKILKKRKGIADKLHI